MERECVCVCVCVCVGGGVKVRYHRVHTIKYSSFKKEGGGCNMFVNYVYVYLLQLGTIE